MQFIYSNRSLKQCSSKYFTFYSKAPDTAICTLSSPPAPPPSLRSARVRGESGDARDLPPQDQRVNVVRALVGVHGLQVAHVPEDVVLVRYAVPPEHVPRGPRDLERPPAAVPLDQRHHARMGIPGLHEPSHLQASQPAEGYVRYHVGELLLHELVGPQGRAELPASRDVLPRAREAVLGGPERPPRYPVSRVVQAAEWTADDV